MTPKQYEALVASHFATQGYRVTQTPYSNDYGIDVFAEKSSERLAIQAKMYGGTKRKINRATVMQLHGALKYAKCSSGVIVTDGGVLADAQKVADKLEIKILFLSATGSAGLSDSSVQKPIFQTKTGNKGNIDFDEVWRIYVIPLAGKIVKTKTGKTNTILSVDWSGINRKSSTGAESFIPIDPFKFAVARLITEGHVSRDEILQSDGGRYSSGVFAVLSQVPMFTVDQTGPATLRYKARH